MRKRAVCWTITLVVLAGLMVALWPKPADAAPARWRFQSIWVPSITLWKGDKYWVDLMNVMAAGDLDIKWFAGGTLVTRSDEMFDAVAKGTIDAGTDWPSYWEGKNTAFGLITSTPVWLTPGDYMIWFWQAGGLELAQELYSKYGIVWFPHSVTGPESGQRSNKPIKTSDDYKGVKMRQCGRVQAKILQDLGGAAIFMPGAEIYLALSRGTIDAAEFSVPGVDWSMGFQEVTKYWVLPGWHQPGPVSGVMINKAAWDKASDRVKFLAKEAAMASMMWAWTFYELNAADFTQKFKEKGIQTNILDQDAINKITDIAYKYLIEDAEANPDHAKIAFSQAKYLKDFAEWRSIEQPFMFGRNPPKLDQIYTKLEEIAKKHKVYDAVIEIQKASRARMDAQEFWKPGTPYTGNPVAPIK